MKILLINKYHYKKGGAERAYFDMADILREAGHEVAFFSMNHEKNEQTPWSKYFISEVDYRDQGYSIFQKLKAALKIIWNHEANVKLGALIEEFKPDIAHAHNIYHQLSPSIFHVLRRKKVPITLTLHDYKIVSPNYNLYSEGAIWDHSSGLRCIIDRCIQKSFLRSIICAFEKWIHGALGSYHLVNLFIAPSQFLVSKAEELGWNGRGIKVLPNPLREAELLPQIANITPIENRLVFFGRLSEEKGIDQILRALPQVSEKSLRIIGEGPFKESLQKLVRELSLEERVQFIGPLFGKSLQNELIKAEAVVIPSAWYENLPYVVTESLALGLVVVASKSGGISERINHGINGFLYEMGDVTALAEIMRSLHAKNLQVLRENARTSVQDLSPQVFIRRLESLYRELL